MGIIKEFEKKNNFEVVHIKIVKKKKNRKETFKVQKR